MRLASKGVLVEVCRVAEGERTQTEALRPSFAPPSQPSQPPLPPPPQPPSAKMPMREEETPRGGAAASVVAFGGVYRLPAAERPSGSRLRLKRKQPVDQPVQQG